MLEDIFVEGSVAKHPSTGQRMVAYVFIALGILAFFAGFLYPPFMMIGWMIGIAFFVVFYLYNRSLEVDFDYSVTNGVFDVAKVTNKEKRKELCTVDLKEELVLVAPNGHDSLRPGTARLYDDCQGFQGRQRGIRHFLPARPGGPAGPASGQAQGSHHCKRLIFQPAFGFRPKAG